MPAWFGKLESGLECSSIFKKKVLYSSLFKELIFLMITSSKKKWYRCLEEPQGLANAIEHNHRAE
jgi:hypothetical protein